MSWRSVLALAVLGGLILGCAGARKAVHGLNHDGIVGYSLEPEKVVFVFDVGDYGYVTVGGSGEWLELGDIEIKSVALAGEFNDWSENAWPMDKDSEGRHRLTKDVDTFRGQDEWQFKFVINERFWVEPPSDATNSVPTGLGNNSQNLVLRVFKPGI
jgi:hypothetical protein